MKHIDELGKVNLSVECFVVCGNEVLLFQRDNNSSKFPGWWTIPGGHIDENEDAISATVREVKEETGVTISEKNTKLKAIAFNYHKDYKDVWTAFAYLATISKKQKIQATDETEGKGKWFSISKVLKIRKLFPPIKYELEHALNDKPGILYTNLTWNNSKLIKVNSERVDKNY